MPWSSFSECWVLSQLFHSFTFIPWTAAYQASPSMGFSRQDCFYSASQNIFRRFFSSSLLSAIRVVSFAYLRLWVFLLAILNLACSSLSPEFHMTYSAYKLSKQGDNIQPWHTPFPVWNQSVVPCLVLTVSSWPVYRFLRRQVRWSDIPIS